MNKQKVPVFKAPVCLHKGVALVCFLIVGFAAQRSSAADIDWTVAPYLWLPGVELDAGVNNNPTFGADVTLNNLIDKLDGAFMGHAEGRGKRFGLFIDTIYMSLADSNTIPIGPGGPILGDLVTDSRLTLKLYDLGSIYRFGNDGPVSAEFDILLGARVIDIDLNIDAILPGPGMMPVNATVGGSETDVLLGGRAIGDFTDRWHYKLHADFSAGETDGTYNLQALVGYSFGETGLFSLDVGYRYMSIKFKKDASGTTTESDLIIAGPLVGFIFNF